MGTYTKAIIINSPNNPSGAVYSDEFIAGVVELCEKRNLYLIMDDTYNRLIFDGRTPTNVYDFTQAHSLDSSKLVVINCVSKMYAMTGFRIGWTVGSKEVVRAMTNIQSQETSGPAAPSQWAAVGALNGVQSSIESLRLTLENNRNVMMKRLGGFSGVKVVKPGGTFYCFPDFSAYEKDSQKLCRLLLDKVRVVTVPGREFGMEGHLRMSFCGTIKEITEGIERIKWALDPDGAQRALPGRPQTSEGLAMNPYLDLPSPAQPEAGKLASHLRPAKPRPDQSAPRLLEPAHRVALRRDRLPRRGAHLASRPGGREHRQAHRARRRRQVRRPRALHRKPRLVGRVQPALQRR